MTKHNFRLLDIYTDYLLSSFGATTATPLCFSRSVVLLGRKHGFYQKDGPKGVRHASQKQPWISLSSLDFSAQASYTLSLESVPFPVIVVREVFIPPRGHPEDGTEGFLLLCSSDLSLSGSALFPIYQKRWKYHKSLKSNAGLAKSPTKLPHTQQNHIFASIVAFLKLESYRCATHLDHFALKAKLYHGAIQAAFEQFQQLKNNHPKVAITS